MAYIIKLKKANKSLVVKHVTRNVTLKHVGRRGPAGVDGTPGPPGNDGLLHAVIAGTNISVDNTDPANPIVSSTGGGAVDSVNSQTGVVVLDTDDISDASTTNKYVTAAEKTKLSNLSGTNTGDQDLSVYVPTSRTVNTKALSSNITLNQDEVLDGTTYKQYSATEKTKLAGIATGATANSSDATLLARANHTGTQAIATVSGLQAALDSKEATANKGIAGGYADLDGSGKVPTAQLPAYVDDVVEAANFAALPGTGESGKIYVTLDDNKVYRWSGSAYVEISASLALGETSGTAYRGDRGKTAYDHSQLTSGNPHNVTKSDVGLANADNTSDATKNTAVATLTNKTLTTPTISATGFTNAQHAHTGATSGGQLDHTTALTNVGTNTHAAIDTHIAATAAHGATGAVVGTTNTQTLTNKTLTSPVINTPTGITKSDVGLGNVDNTSDANKPVSTAQLTAIDAKVADAINDGTTTVAPSQNAVFDALALKQPLDSDLTTIAGLTATTDSIIQSKSSAWTTRTPAQFKTDLALVKGDVGLGNVDNTSDANKPVSTATQTALDAKQPLDSDLTTIAGLTATTDNFMVGASSAWASRTPAQAKTSLALTKTDVGLSNVDNTSNATERAATATLTNKRITMRTGTTASSATPTIGTDSVDYYSITALAVDITSFTTNLSGTPTTGQTLWLAITGTSSRAITWGATFESSTVLLPTTTSGTNRLDVGFVWNEVSLKWRCVSAA